MWLSTNNRTLKVLSLRCLIHPENQSQWISIIYIIYASPIWNEFSCKWVHKSSKFKVSQKVQWVKVNAPTRIVHEMYFQRLKWPKGEELFLHLRQYSWEPHRILIFIENFLRLLTMSWAISNLLYTYPYICIVFFVRSIRKREDSGSKKILQDSKGRFSRIKSLSLA